MRSCSPLVILPEMNVSPSTTLVTLKEGQWKQQRATGQSGAWLGGVGVMTWMVKGKGVAPSKGASTAVQAARTTIAATTREAFQVTPGRCHVVYHLGSLRLSRGGDNPLASQGPLFISGGPILF